jgi:hypothetical protein
LAIRDIKDEYDLIAQQGKHDMESWYKLKVWEFIDLNKFYDIHSTFDAPGECLVRVFQIF